MSKPWAQGSGAPDAFEHRTDPVLRCGRSSPRCARGLGSGSLVIGAWALVICWSLRFGAWSFLPALSPQPRDAHEVVLDHLAVGGRAALLGGVEQLLALERGEAGPV